MWIILHLQEGKTWSLLFLLLLFLVMFDYVWLERGQSLFCPVVCQWKTAQEKGLSPYVWESRSEPGLILISKRAWGSAVFSSTERFHRWTHHCFNFMPTFFFFFLKGTVLSLLLPAPQKYVQSIPATTLALPQWHYLPVPPCPSVSLTTAWVGSFNKWYWGLPSSIHVSLKPAAQEYYKEMTFLIRVTLLFKLLLTFLKRRVRMGVFTPSGPQWTLRWRLCLFI